MINRTIRTVLIAIALSCALYSQTCAASAEATSAEQLYETAFKLIVAGNYGDAYEQLDEIITKHPGTIYAQFAVDRKQRLEKLNLLSIRRKQIDQHGRIGTVVFSTLYSTWLGLGTARLVDDEEGEKAVAAGMMIGAPTGLLTSLVLTRNARLTRGQSALINFSGYWGTWQGTGLAILITEADDEKPLIRGAIAGGLLGLLTTSVLTRKIDLSLGDASIINYGVLWGTWLSLNAGMVAAIEGENSRLGLTLAGGNLGAAAMALLSSKIDISFARANLINLGGVVGTIVAGGVLVIGAESVASAETAFAVLMAGGIGGLIVAALSTSDFDGGRMSQKARRKDPGRNDNPTKWHFGPRTLQVSHSGVRSNLFSIQF